MATWLKEGEDPYKRVLRLAKESEPTPKQPESTIVSQKEEAWKRLESALDNIGSAYINNGQVGKYTAAGRLLENLNTFKGKYDTPSAMSGIDIDELFSGIARVGPVAYFVLQEALEKIKTVE